MKVGIAGMGAVGLSVAKALDRGTLQGLEFAGFCASSDSRGAELNKALTTPVPIYGMDSIADHCDIVVECLPPARFADIADPVIEAGKTLVVLSASQLLGRADLIERAKETGARIIVPSGAMLGIDALKAVAVGELKSVTIKTSKPVAGLLNAPYLAKVDVDLTKIKEPYRLMAGSVSEIAKEFPANVNVAAALSLAGLGPERTKMEIWADPSLSHNLHTVGVTSDSSDFTVSIQNRPSDENPATGRITAQSVIALFQQMTSNLIVGT
ncbi:aspartate dehydrogenase [Octadecabacter temperatus]|uniref:L-aspartate dehydrogenase n=1 Tax=Octadecabacter temperatus TaxID=1458307 RepID=A0A0K0Y3B4_9RHOB|nr:aspartate dehydrogenase [Octadecabacter temperatus]AKS45357.1 L-aspartate dehydrogenase [Octadecabacter temperatus]SIN91209.1 aspartate dehydrogenase [Octadecabacter temperatus]